MDSFNHLDEQALEQLPDGRWIPAIPLPFYGHKGLTRKEYFGCSCGQKFDSELAYQLHYRTEQFMNYNTKVQEAHGAKAADPEKVSG